jgi:hypothetical protein
MQMEGGRVRHEAAARAARLACAEGPPVGGTFQFQNPGGDAGRTRKALNLATMRELQLAFNRGGKQAIDKVMKNNPAMFLKMLVLLVPRELQVEHSGGVKAMTDEQIEQAIELIKEMLAQREAGANAKVVGGIAEPVPALPPPCRERKKTAPPSAGKTS